MVVSRSSQRMIPISMHLCHMWDRVVIQRNRSSERPRPRTTRAALSSERATRRRAYSKADSSSERRALLVHRLRIQASWLDKLRDPAAPPAFSETKTHRRLRPYRSKHHSSEVIRRTQTPAAASSAAQHHNHNNQRSTNLRVCSEITKHLRASSKHS